MNGPDANAPQTPDPQDPFAGQAQPQQDFSQYEDPLPDIGSSDTDTIKKMNRRTSPVGRIMTVVLVVGAVGLAFWAYQNSATYETRMDALQAAGELEGPAMLAALREAYKGAQHDDVRERILLNLGAFDDEASLPLMVEALDTPGIVRRAGARALAHMGSPKGDIGKAKLLEVLPLTDARDRPQVVWALAVLGEQAAVPEILKEFSSGHLQNLEGLDKEPAFDPKVIADVVGPAKLSSPELLKHEEKSVRTLVAKTLSESASPEVVPGLITLLDDSEIEVVRQAAAGLGRSGDDRAGTPLFALLSKRPGMRHGVLEAIAKSTSAPGIAKLIDAAEKVDVQRSLASRLAETHDPRSAEPLAKLLSHEDADVKQIAALALAQLGDARSIPFLVEQSSHEDRDTALDAIDALSLLRSPEVGAALAPLLKDPANAGRKSGLLKAIGLSGNAAAGKAVMAELAGDDVESASYALADLKYEPAYSKMLAQLKRPPKVDFSRPSIPTEEIVRNREIAIRTLGRYGKPDAIPGLMTLLEDPLDSAKLRGISGEVLGQLANAETLAQIVAKAKDSSIPEDVRKVYVRGLWSADVSAGTEPLMGLLQPSVAPEIRRAAALAIGYAADPANDQVLLDMLKTPELRRDAGFAIVLGGSEEAGSALYNALNTDRELREVLQGMLMADDIDWFSRITAQNFESGQVYRRLRVAEILKTGAGEITFAYPWMQVTKRLKSGWSGTGGISARDIRTKLWEGLRGDDALTRRLSAEALTAMGERGLLLASRDQAGPGQSEARAIILRENRGH